MKKEIQWCTEIIRPKDKRYVQVSLIICLVHFHIWGSTLNLKGWIIKCISGVVSHHVKTKTHMNCRERIYSTVSLSFMGNGRNKYRKINSSGKVLTVLRRMAKPTSTTASMGFYLLGRIPTTFLGPRMLTLPSPSQSNPLVSGQSRSTDLCVRFSAPLLHPQFHMRMLPMVGMRTWVGHLTTAAHRGR